MNCTVEAHKQFEVGAGLALELAAIKQQRPPWRTMLSTTFLETTIMYNTKLAGRYYIACVFAREHRSVLLWVRKVMLQIRL